VERRRMRRRPVNEIVEIQQRRSKHALLLSSLVLAGVTVAIVVITAYLAG
jgi:predicted nucleic acid-binding Zn ribbon protein